VEAKNLKENQGLDVEVCKMQKIASRVEVTVQEVGEIFLQH